METQLLDRTTEILREVLDYLEHDRGELLLEITLEGKTITSTDQTWGLEPFVLEVEIKNNFKDAKESTLQDRYANYVTDKLTTYVQPLKSLSKKESEKFSIDSIWPISTAFDERTEEQKKILNWISSYGMLYEQVSLIEVIIGDLLRIFAPSHYKFYYESYGFNEDSFFKLSAPMTLLSNQNNIHHNKPTIQDNQQIKSQHPQQKVNFSHLDPSRNYIISEIIDELTDIFWGAKMELITWKMNADNLQITSRQLASERTKSFVEPKIWNSVANEIKKGISKHLSSLNESILQDRFANYLVTALNETLIPCFSVVNNYYCSTIERVVEIRKKKNYDNLTNKELIIYDNNDFWRQLNDSFYGCCIAIIDKIQEFLPDLYDVYYENWSKEIKLNRQSYIYNSTTLNQTIPPIVSGTKLKWNGSNDSLYDLFAQLSLQNVTQSKPLIENTIEGIAKFLHEHVENMPSIETIERRIRAFREPNGERPKRNRIEIDIRKGDS